MRSSWAVPPHLPPSPRARPRARGRRRGRPWSSRPSRRRAGRRAGGGRRPAGSAGSSPGRRARAAWRTHSGDTCGASRPSERSRSPAALAAGARRRRGEELGLLGLVLLLGDQPLVAQAGDLADQLRRGVGRALGPPDRRVADELRDVLGGLRARASGPAPSPSTAPGRRRAAPGAPAPGSPSRPAALAHPAALTGRPAAVVPSDMMNPETTAGDVARRARAPGERGARPGGVPRRPRASSATPAATASPTRSSRCSRC